MKVSLEIASEHTEPHAVIYANEISSEITQLIHLIEKEEKPIIVEKDDKQIVLTAEEIFMVRIEEGKAVIYLENQSYYSRDRLYEIQNKLGKGFIQISKQTIIKLSAIKHIEPGFSGHFVVNMKNDLKDTVTRKYLPDLKRYLGL